MDADLLRRCRSRPISATAVIIAKLTDPPQSSLESWLERPEEHERVAVGEKVERGEAEKQRFLNDVEKKVDGLAKWWSK